MKKSLFAWAMLLPLIMLTIPTACVKESLKDTITVGLKADAVFSESGQANVTITLSATPKSMVQISLASSSVAQSGYTAVSADLLSFGNIVTISGAASTTVTVSADIASLDDNYQAVITIASADGAKIDPNASTVYIGVPQNISRQLSGADSWKIAGNFEDIALAKTADSPETWTVENAVFGGEFTFSGTKGDTELKLGSSSSVTLGSEVALAKDGNAISLEEGSYNVTLYPAELKMVITEGSPQAHVLDWNVEYKGQQWVEGFYTSGQMDVFEVSNTNPSKYYIVYFSDLNNEYMESYGESLHNDPEAFFSEMQQNIDYYIEMYEEYGMTIKDFFDDYCYNEIIDGTTLYFYGQPAGEYEFLILSMDDQGQLDLGYKYITISKDSDPETQYDWDIVPNIREDWTGAFSEWEPGYEGQYFLLDGYAPGASYAVIDVYTDAEIDWYLGGDVKNFIGNLNENIQSNLRYGYSVEEIFAYYGAPVDENGYFTGWLSTYNIVGEANLLIVGFDSEGNLINTSALSNGADLGLVVMEMPVYEPEPLYLFNNENWGGYYAGTYYDDYYGADMSIITLTGLEPGDYVAANVFEKGDLTDDNLADNVRNVAEGMLYGYKWYREDDETLADYAFTVDYPWVRYWAFTEEQYGEWDLLIAGVSEDAEITGEYALVTITVDGTTLDGNPTLSVKTVKRGRVNTARPAKVHSNTPGANSSMRGSGIKKNMVKMPSAEKPVPMKGVSAKIAF